MEMGNAIGVAMEASVAAFGDGNAALNLLDEAVAGRCWGGFLRRAAVTGRVFLRG